MEEGNETKSFISRYTLSLILSPKAYHRRKTRNNFVQLLLKWFKSQGTP